MDCEMLNSYKKEEKGKRQQDVTPCWRLILAQDHHGRYQFP